MDEELNPDLKRCQDAADALAEHFDSVQIFCSRHEGGDIGTISVNFGRGNWFARRGHVQDWILKEAERTKEEVRHENDE